MTLPSPPYPLSFYRKKESQARLLISDKNNQLFDFVRFFPQFQLTPHRELRIQTTGTAARRISGSQQQATQAKPASRRVSQTASPASNRPIFASQPFPIGFFFCNLASQGLHLARQP
ncbi:hypothetical protein [Roseobacter sp. SK209-2-6]|uniref:hypothetical protein n=1 Tax=Roseobacter sp. SK209-2-6 TaxID=388739 RepID=UPI0012F4F4EA|nr:hypothetical protein [Roseobacter sp. SK209-2-6]